MPVDRYLHRLKWLEVIYWSFYIYCESSLNFGHGEIFTWAPLDWLFMNVLSVWTRYSSLLFLILTLQLSTTKYLILQTSSSIFVVVAFDLFSHSRGLVLLDSHNSNFGIVISIIAIAKNYGVNWGQATNHVVQMDFCKIHFLDWNSQIVSILKEKLHNKHMCTQCAW